MASSLHSSHPYCHQPTSSLFLVFVTIFSPFHDICFLLDIKTSHTEAVLAQQRGLAGATRYSYHRTEGLEPPRTSRDLPSRRVPLSHSFQGRVRCLLLGCWPGPLLYWWTPVYLEHTGKSTQCTRCTLWKVDWSLSDNQLVPRVAFPFQCWLDKDEEQMKAP